MVHRFNHKKLAFATHQARRAPRSRHLMSSLVLLSLAAGASVASQAQEADRAKEKVLEKVIVTATRREESLQVVPASITAVTAQELKDRGVNYMPDIQKIAAGLFLEQVGSMTNTSIYIRGVGTGGVTATDQSVGVMVDGIYQIRQGTAFTELLDVERVEVMRGPQGKLFGKNTTAGVVAITTHNPELDEFSGNIQGVVGNLDNRELRGVINVPLLNNTLALRVGAYTAERDGYTKNLFTGEDTRNVDRYGYRGKILWSPSDKFEAVLSVEQLKQKKDHDQVVVQYAEGSDPGLPPVSLGRAQQNHSETDEEVERYILTLQWDIGNHTLKSLTGYEDVASFLLQDRDGTIVPSQLVLSDVITKITTQEFQLLSQRDGPLNYVLGVFYQNQELYSPTYFSVSGGEPFLVNLTDTDTDSLATFANFTYDFTDQLSLSLGARYTDDEKIGPSDGVELKENFREWTYSTKFRYQIAADKMVYFAWDHGFKSGGINRSTVGGLFEPIWEPEFADNYELGIKSQWWDSRLRWNAAVFYTAYDDFQVSTTFSDTAVSAISNAGEVESKGIETDFYALLTSHFSVSGSLAYIKTEYKEYDNAPCEIYDPQPECRPDGTIDQSGETLDHAPEWTVNLGAEYRAPLTSGMEWFIRGDAAYRDDQNLATSLHPVGEQGSYTLYNARVGLEAADGRWKVAMWGSNLGDEEYIVAGDINSFGHWTQT